MSLLFDFMTHAPLVFKARILLFVLLLLLFGVVVFVPLPPVPPRSSASIISSPATQWPTLAREHYSPSHNAISLPPCTPTTYYVYEPGHACLLFILVVVIGKNEVYTSTLLLFVFIVVFVLVLAMKHGRGVYFLFAYVTSRFPLPLAGPPTSLMESRRSLVHLTRAVLGICVAMFVVVFLKED